MSQTTGINPTAGRLVRQILLLALLTCLVLASGGAEQAPQDVPEQRRVKFVRFVKNDAQPDACMHLDEHIREIASNVENLEGANDSQWCHLQLPDNSSKDRYTYILAVDTSTHEARGICFHHGAYEWIPDSNACFLVSPGQAFNQTWDLAGTQINLKIKTQSHNTADCCFTTKQDQ